MTLLFYISGHGLGHASRQIELIRALIGIAPNARIVVRTAAPQWLFDATAPTGIDFQPVQADSGVVQIDSLRHDEAETVRRAAAFYRDFDRRVDEEAAFIRLERAALVIGDIPPLAFAAAARAGVPSVAVGNFTWDWIYESYPGFEARAPGVIDIISGAYAQATRALRLPMHGGFSSLSDVTRDIPFITRQSRRNRLETRLLLGAAEDRPLVLVSFGAYGVQLALSDIAQSQHLTVIAPRELPAGLEYQDIVAAADAVVSKPGYGIISDCVANNAPLLYTSRGHFAEYDVMVAEMPRVLRCGYIPQQDLFAGRWTEHLDALLKQPVPAERPRIDGAAIAAEEILTLC